MPNKEDPDTMLVPLYLPKNIHMELKLYCVKVGKPMKEILKPISDMLEQEVLKLVANIKEMERIADEKRRKEEEDQRLASEHPLEVSGQQIENPISQ